jgi:tetratricopeptide (TPR) repeat protein
MYVAEEAIRYNLSGQQEEAQQRFLDAFELERQAALAVAESEEPTRSVLLRSAATLAMHAGQFREAEKMISTALAGDPPLEILDELRDLYIQLNEKQATGAAVSEEEEQLQPIELTGKLTYADADHKNIQISDADGIRFPYLIRVTKGFDELVRSYWKKGIRIRGLRRPDSNRIFLIEIRKAKD